METEKKEKAGFRSSSAGQLLFWPFQDRMPLRLMLSFWFDSLIAQGCVQTVAYDRKRRVFSLCHPEVMIVNCVGSTNVLQISHAMNAFVHESRKDNLAAVHLVRTVRFELSECSRCGCVLR